MDSTLLYITLKILCLATKVNLFQIIFYDWKVTLWSDYIYVSVNIENQGFLKIPSDF